MADRPTKELQTPVDGHKVVYYEWVNGSAKRALSAAKTPDEQQRLMVQFCIVSIDGETNNLMQKIDEMHGKDFDSVFLKLADVLVDSSLSPEKKSS